MELDLTPKKYRKKVATKRRRKTSHLARNWNNPFQRAIIGISLIAFFVSIVVERFQDRRTYEKQFGRAVSLAAEIAGLDQQATEKFQALERATADLILKQKTDQEVELGRQLDELNQQVNNLFLQVAACCTSLPPRYRNKSEVLQWGIDFTSRYIDSALARKDHEQARVWFNASGFNIFLPEIRSRVEGTGTLEIAAEEQFGEVEVFPVKSDGPRLVPCDPLRKGYEFPFVVPELPPGSYQLWATRTNGTFSTVPVLIEHGEYKHIRLETPPSVPAGMAYIPAGGFYCGGEASPIYRRHKRTLPAFLMKKKEVTIGEYLEFWSTLAASEKRNSFISRIHYRAGDKASPAWNEEGVLMDECLNPDYPVVGIPHAAAEAYCEWMGGKLGRVVRLPTAFEWEKAARGVDGRTYPWGYGFDPEALLTLTLDNPKGKIRYPHWAPVGSFGRDVSVYNVYDMGGNVREMTATPMPDQADVFQIKGGSASTPASFLPCAFVSDSPAVPSDIGFRYVVEWSGEDL